MTRPLSYGRGTAAGQLPGPAAGAIGAPWQQAAGAVISGLVDASGSTVTITPKASAPVWSDDAGRTVTTSTDPIYSGTAIVAHARSSAQPSGAAKMFAAGEQPDYVNLYTIRLPWGTNVGDVGDVVTVTTNPDPTLVDVRLTVLSSTGDGTRFSRILYATANAREAATS